MQRADTTDTHNSGTYKELCGCIHYSNSPGKESPQRESGERERETDTPTETHTETESVGEREESAR